MRRYETIIILDPDLSNEERTPVFEKLNDMIPHHGGFLVMNDDWGVKKLAYEIKKKARGYYVRLDYCGTGTLVDEMERFFRIDDRVLKFMTVLLDKNADVERIKEEKARAEAEEAEKIKETEDDLSVQKDESDSDQTPSNTPGPEVAENETTQTKSNE